MDAHILYDNGEWPAPSWLDDGTASRIRRRNYQESGMRVPIDKPISELPSVSWNRGAPAITAEGVSTGDLKDEFESTQPQQHSRTERADPTENQSGKESVESGSHTPDGASVEASDRTSSDAPWAELTDRLDAIEASLDDLCDRNTVEEIIETEVETIESKLETLETGLAEVSDELAKDEPPTVTATVLRQSDLVLFRVDPSQINDIDEALPHESEVELALLTESGE